MSTIKLDWLQEFKETANHDAELNAIGRWFDSTFSINFGSDRVAFDVREGAIAEIIIAPSADVRSAFGFSAPSSVWAKFFMKEPPALYHDFFAMMMRVPEFILEGDSLVAMQNARALHRTMSIMQETGAKYVAA